MKLTILGCGTSTGVPIPGCDCRVCTSPNPRNYRNRTSALLSIEGGRNILVDASPDLRQQALQFNIKRVDAVIFTHAHADHILGIEDLRGYNFLHRKAIPCYGSEETIRTIGQVFHYIVHPNPDYEGGLLAKLDFTPISPYQNLTICGVQIQSFLLMHGKMEVMGYRFGSCAYATDCNFIPEQSVELLNGVKTLILDGLRYEEHRTHFTIPEAVKVAQQLGVERTYLTHTTHAIEYEETNAQLPDGIELAYDGLVIEC